MVKQLSVFVENKPGRLMEVLQALAERNIDIKALSLADTTEFGIIRMVVSNAEEAKEALKEKPGALMKTFAVLSDNKISVEYMYAFGEKLKNSSVIAIRTDNPELAEEKLSDGGVTVLEHDDIAEM